MCVVCGVAMFIVRSQDTKEAPVDTKEVELTEKVKSEAEEAAAEPEAEAEGDAAPEGKKEE